MARPSRPRAGRGRGGRQAGSALPLTWWQHDLLLDSLEHRGTGRHVEQLSWRWCGPLDTERFTAAWQSVADRETVLRAAVDWEPWPRVVLHDRAAVEVVRHRAGGVDWDELVERDRLRGFDLRGRSRSPGCPGRARRAARQACPRVPSGSRTPVPGPGPGAPASAPSRGCRACARRRAAHRPRGRPGRTPPGARTRSRRPAVRGGR